MRPRITGNVDRVYQDFMPGKMMRKGDWLVKLESDDYELALETAKAELARAQSLYEIEMGEQEVAKNDFAKLNKDCRCTIP